MARPRPSGGGLARALWNVARVLFAITAIIFLIQIRGSMSWVTYALTIAIAFSALVTTLGFRRDVLLAVGYVLGFAVFSMLRGMTDGTPVPVQFDYVIWLEGLLPGPLPNIWLQGHLRTPGEVNFLDRVMVGVHLSYFLVPVIVGCALWRWRRELFARYVVTLLVVYYAGLLASFLLPTAPPWLASDSGQLTYVAKVGDWVYGAVGADGYTRDVVRMNPVAAMPSLHMAITAVVALGMARFGRPWALAGAGYTLLMAFALVHLGEHYVVDEIAGVLMGVCLWAAVFSRRSGSPAARESRSEGTT